MSYLVIRPYWNVPIAIQRGEIVPKLRKDPDYLVKNQMEVVDSHGAVVTAGAVSAEQLARLNTGALSVRQKPGPKNSLGLAKFVFPNEHNVYLHSTPSQELFSRTRRDFSHGCIRVEYPAKLAEWILYGNGDWTLDKIQDAMNNGKDSQQVNLKQKRPVVIVYATAVVLPDGTVKFFQDIYGHDARLKKALGQGFPRPHRFGTTNAAPAPRQGVQS
jgi:murein L,D-transpeptidase YcbB/YkuD